MTILDLKNAVAKHNICDFPLENENEKGQCIMFDAYCEYRGLHYHHLIITIIDNGKIERSKHSLRSDDFIAFIISKIKCFELTRSGYPIFIHRAIADGPEIFYDNKSCRKIGDWLHPFFVNRKFPGLRQYVAYS